MYQQVRIHHGHQLKGSELGRLVRAGALDYNRTLVLPRLLPVGPDDLHGPEPTLGRRLCTMIVRALRAERNRGRSGHWTYSLNRHIGLMQALKAERAALSVRTARRRATRTGPEAEPPG
jgi:hypothetical protein